MSATTTPDARRTAERERVAEACRALLSSDGWRRWVRARSAFHSYSLNNQLLIAFQAPNATHVAGFHTWRKLGRQVRKGEKSIRILAPLLIRESEPNANGAPTSPAGPGQERVAKQLIGYRTVSVFDLSQTDPIPGADPLPLEPPSAPISGNSHAHLRPALVEHAASLGYTVSYEATDGCDGYCDRTNRRIAVAAALPPNAQVRILIHECCHAHGADYKTYDRASCEVIVDCATHIACATIGLDVSSETIPYITGWGEADDALAAVTRFASVIDGLAGSIEAALADANDNLRGSVVEPS
jgi:antirestriction protein ArdC